MITTQTRRASYEKVLTTLSLRQQIILLKFTSADNVRFTARELAEALYKDGAIISNDRNMVQPRLTEMVNAGLLEVVGKKRDELMGRHVAYYGLKMEENK